MKFELLAPAGDLEKLKVAVLYGADAVFIGGERFSLRSRASNFTLKDIEEGCLFAHRHHAKVHVTCNIVMHEVDIEGIEDYLKALERAGVDAIIASSLAILKLVKEKTKMEAHASTQLSVLNSGAMEFFESFHIDRVVLGREVSLEELRMISSKTSLDLEVFIHGGMCTSYSGRCMMSNYMTYRDANRGGCAHSCRWKYFLFDEEKHPLGSTYLSMSSKDLSVMSVLPQLLKLKIASFKIEGRMKSLHYIACVVFAYRKMIDEYVRTKKIEDFSVYEKMLAKAENRETSTGFLKEGVTLSEQLTNLDEQTPLKNFVGIILDYDTATQRVTLEQRNYFSLGQKLEIFSPRGIFPIKITALFDEEGNEVKEARHAQQKLYFDSEIPLCAYDILRLDDSANF